MVKLLMCVTLFATAIVSVRMQDQNCSACPQSSTGCDIKEKTSDDLSVIYTQTVCKNGDQVLQRFQNQYPNPNPGTSVQRTYTRSHQSSGNISPGNFNQDSVFNTFFNSQRFPNQDLNRFGSNPFGSLDSTDFGSSGFGNSGFGNSGFGNSGFGNSGFGNSGFGNNGFGSNGFGNSGFGSNQPSNNQPSNNQPSNNQPSNSGSNNQQSSSDSNPEPEDFDGGYVPDDA